MADISKYVRHLLTLLAILSSAPAVAADIVLANLSQQNPRLRFHMGEVENNQPKISPLLPAIPGPVSNWYVAQWQQSSYIGAQDLLVHDPAARDPRLGIADYDFSAPDGHSHVWIFRKGPGWVYELYERGGMLSAGGGSNLFLSNDAIGPAVTFDHTIIYSLDAKISHAAIRYDTPQAEPTGGVLSQAFTGMGLLLRDPADGQEQFVFMQLPLTLSRPLGHGPGFICTLAAGKPNLLFAPEYKAGELVLPYRDDPGPLHHISYILNDYVRRLVAAPYPCGGRIFSWPVAAHDMANWRLTGLYVGLETEITDNRLGAATHKPQGAVETALQLANLEIVRN